MKSHFYRFNHRVFNILVLATVVLCLGLSATAQEKLKTEDIIAKHLEAIGAIETRASITTRIIAGTVEHKVARSGGQSLQGRAVFASDGVKHLVGMQFDNPNYPFDRLSYDGQNSMAAFTRPGEQSTLGKFLKANEEALKYGLLGGVLSSSWPLADPNSRNIKLSGSGKKKIEGKECYEIEILPKKGSQANIKAYFDATTFQHVRTVYEIVIPAQMGQNSDPNSSARQRETRYKMVEDFSDFKKEGGLAFPHVYKLSLTLDGKSGGTNELEWTFALGAFQFNQKIDPKSFVVE